jgi:regulator of sigma E protease
MNILIFFIILIVLILVHEAGHFSLAKFFKIRVDEFGFGFPPKLFGIKKGETEYTVNAIPFGGFVKIFGENPDAESIDGPEASRSFVNKPKWQQAIVLLAGITANFLLAWILLSVGFMSGLPTSTSSQPKNSFLTDINLTVVSVSKDSPAELAGLKSGDKIVAVRSSKENLNEINPENFKALILENANREIEIDYLRGKNSGILSTTAIPRIEAGSDLPLIGIAMDQIGKAKMGFFRSFSEGLKLTCLVTKNTAIGLFTLIRDGIKGQGSFSAIMGPVGMVGIVGDAYDFGFIYLLSFTALISINLAIINLIPFPALDGGRLLFLLIEKIKGSRLNPKIANMTNAIGFIILIALMLLVTYHDIIKLF